MYKNLNIYIRKLQIWGKCLFLSTLFIHCEDKEEKLEEVPWTKKEFEMIRSIIPENLRDSISDKVIAEKMAPYIVSLGLQVSDKKEDIDKLKILAENLFNYGKNICDMTNEDYSAVIGKCKESIMEYEGHKKEDDKGEVEVDKEDNVSQINIITNYMNSIKERDTVKNNNTISDLCDELLQIIMKFIGSKSGDILEYLNSLSTKLNDVKDKSLKEICKVLQVGIADGKQFIYIHSKTDFKDLSNFIKKQLITSISNFNIDSKEDQYEVIKDKLKAIVEDFIFTQEGDNINVSLDDELIISNLCKHFTNKSMNDAINYSFPSSSDINNADFTKQLLNILQPSNGCKKMIDIMNDATDKKNLPIHVFACTLVENIEHNLIDKKILDTVKNNFSAVEFTIFKILYDRCISKNFYSDIIANMDNSIRNNPQQISNKIKDQIIDLFGLDKNKDNIEFLNPFGTSITQFDDDKEISSITVNGYNFNKIFPKECDTLLSRVNKLAKNLGLSYRQIFKNLLNNLDEEKLCIKEANTAIDMKAKIFQHIDPVAKLFGKCFSTNDPTDRYYLGDSTVNNTKSAMAVISLLNNITKWVGSACKAKETIADRVDSFAFDLLDDFLGKPNNVSNSKYFYCGTIAELLFQKQNTRWGKAQHDIDQMKNALKIIINAFWRYNDIYWHSKNANKRYAKSYLKVDRNIVNIDYWIAEINKIDDYDGYYKKIKIPNSLYNWHMCTDGQDPNGHIIEDSNSASCLVMDINDNMLYIQNDHIKVSNNQVFFNEDNIYNAFFLFTGLDQNICLLKKITKGNDDEDTKFGNQDFGILPGATIVGKIVDLKTTKANTLFDTP